MVNFICDGCGASLRKNKIAEHFARCRMVSVTCFDCHVSFPDDEYKAHVECKSEAERYQGKLYKGPRAGERAETGAIAGAKRKRTRSSSSSSSTSTATVKERAAARKLAKQQQQQQEQRKTQTQPQLHPQPQPQQEQQKQQQAIAQQAGSQEERTAQDDPSIRGMQRAASPEAMQLQWKTAMREALQDGVLSYDRLQAAVTVRLLAAGTANVDPVRFGKKLQRALRARRILQTDSGDYRWRG